MNKIYYGVEVVFSKDNYDAVYNLLYAEGIKTILEENGIIKICIEKQRSAELIKEKLLLLPTLRENDISINKLANHDWNKEWENSIEQVYIKDKIIVHPSWKKEELENPQGKILIEIDPKMSFGTGHNETTQMMLEMMCNNIDDKDEYLLDYGCGTAVLAIAGIKLGIKSAVAIDIDEDAVTNAKEYLKNNGVSQRIKLYKANIDEIAEKDFDITVCNIDRTVILSNLNALYSKLKPGGKLFITGILLEEENEVKGSLKKQRFDLIETHKKAEWLAFYYRKIT
jgi:ribosomal protein L11 methyltransferase